MARYRNRLSFAVNSGLGTVRRDESSKLKRKASWGRWGRLTEKEGCLVTSFGASFRGYLVAQKMVSLKMLLETPVDANADQDKRKTAVMNKVD